MNTHTHALYDAGNSPSQAATQVYRCRTKIRRVYRSGTKLWMSARRGLTILQRKSFTRSSRHPGSQGPGLRAIYSRQLKVHRTSSLWCTVLYLHRGTPLRLAARLPLELVRIIIVIMKYVFRFRGKNKYSLKFLEFLRVKLISLSTEFSECIQPCNFFDVILITPNHR